MTRLVRMLVVAGSLTACDTAARHAPPTAPGAAVASLGDPVVQVSRSYSLQLLPLLYEGRFAIAFAINDSGTVVGYGDVNGGQGCKDNAAAFVWNGSKMRNLHSELAASYDMGNPPPGPACAEIWTAAIQVNNLGDVLIPTSFYGDNSVFQWNAASGFLPVGYGGRLGGAVAMNNLRDLVGYVDDGFEPRYAAMWTRNGQFLSIEPREFGSNAFGVSDDGFIIGCVHGRLARWKRGSKGAVLPDSCNEDLAIPFGTFARQVGGVTFDGIAAFSALRNGVPTALVWRRNSVTDAGWSPGAASDISERGRVVGWAYTAGTTPRAVTRLRSGSVEWLPTPAGSTNARAYGVNRCGDIVGSVVDANGVQRAALWRAERCDAAGSW